MQSRAGVLWAVPCAAPWAGCCLGGGVWGLTLGCSNFPVALEGTGDREACPGAAGVRDAQLRVGCCMAEKTKLWVESKQGA